MEAAEGLFPLWPCGHVVSWLCSYVAMWLYGYVVMLLCGYGAMWLCCWLSVIYWKYKRQSETILICVKIRCSIFLSPWRSPVEQNSYFQKYQFVDSLLRRTQCKRVLPPRKYWQSKKHKKCNWVADKAIN